jgi:hypothetical protein
MKKALIITSILLASSASATPLTRYFPDFALASLEFSDLQESVQQTGSFGQDTLKFLSTAADQALQEMAPDLGFSGPVRELTVRSMVGSIRDISVAAYSGKDNPEFLAVIRLTPKNIIVNNLTDAFNNVIKSYPARRKMREGNYLAAVDSGLAIGLGNNLMYISSNTELLRGYLKRLNGANSPVLTNNAVYKAGFTETGNGFIKQMINYYAVAQYLQRSPYGRELPQRTFSALRTLNYITSSSDIVDDGLETRGLTALNANGGDAALYKLLTFTPEKLELLSDMPATAPSVSVGSIDTSGWLEYVQSWLPDVGFSASEQRQATEVFADLKERLGNEWGMIAPTVTNYNSASLAALFGVSSITPTSSITSGFDGDTLYYAKTKDGASVLDDLEVALKDAFESELDSSDSSANSSNTNVEEVTFTVQRAPIGGFDTVILNQSINYQNKTTEANFFIVNKNNTIIIGTDQAKLEGYLTAPSVLENPIFNTIKIPERVNGVQYIAPVRMTRAQIDAMIGDLLKATQLEQDVPQGVVIAFGDWFDSWASRTQVGHGYSLIEGNKLRSYNKTGFSWNK